MAGLPSLLRAFSLDAIGRAMQRAAGAGTSIDLTPSHAIASVVGDVARDLNRAEPWDLVREGPGCVVGRSTIGQAAGFVHTTMETVWHGRDLWHATTADAFNFSTQAWAVMYPWRYDRVVFVDGVFSAGGALMGNLVGPNPDDPYYPTQYYGANRGWGMSSNGDGGFGFMVYGADEWHNTDTVWESYDAADGRWRWAIIGNNPAAKTTYLTVALRTDERAAALAAGLAGAQYGVAACAAASATGTGDLTSPDRFILGGYNYYGAREGNQDGAVGLPLIVFEGSAALNAWLYRFTFLAVLQAQLERAGG